MAPIRRNRIPSNVRAAADAASKRNVRPWYWKSLPKQEKLNHIDLLCKHLGKTREGLTVGDFSKKIPEIKKSLYTLLLSYAKDRISCDALNSLKKDLGIEIDYFVMFNASRAFHWNNVPKENIRQFIDLLCETHKLSIISLIPNDFNLPIPALDNKTLTGLLTFYGRPRLSSMGALVALKKDLGLPLDYIEMFKASNACYWAEIPNNEKIKFIEILCGSLNKSKKALTVPDFKINIPELGDKPLLSLLCAYHSKNISTSKALELLKRDLGIEIDYITMFTGSSMFYWQDVPNDVKKEFIDILCKSRNKSKESLNSHDFMKKLPELGDKTLSGLLTAYKGQNMNLEAAMIALKNDLGIDVDLMILFKEGTHFNWENTSKTFKVKLLKMLCDKLNKPLELLSTGDFAITLPELGDKSLMGMLGSYGDRNSSTVSCLIALKADLGIGIDHIKMYINSFRFNWEFVPKEVKLKFLDILCLSLGKSKKGLIPSDFHKKIPELGKRSLGGLLQSYKVTKSDLLFEDLTALKKDLDIEVDYFTMFKESDTFFWEHITNEIKSQFVDLLCETVKKSREGLLISDFQRPIPELGDKSLYGLYYSYHKNNKAKSEILARLKDDLNISQDYFAMFKEADSFHWEEIPSNIILQFLDLLCKIVKKPKESLIPADFHVNIPELKDKSLRGLLSHNGSRKNSELNALFILKEALGIKGDPIIMFKAVSQFHWKTIPKQVKSQFINILCKVRNKPIDKLNVTDFQTRILELGHKSLFGLLCSYYTKDMTYSNALDALKSDLGIISVNKKGLVDNERIMNKAKEKALVSAVAKWLGVSSLENFDPFSKDENCTGVALIRKKIESEGIVYPQQLLERLNMVSDTEIEIPELMKALTTSAIKVRLPGYGYGKVADLGYEDHVFSSYQANVLRILHILSGNTASGLMKYSAKIKGKTFKAGEVAETLAALDKAYNGKEFTIDVNGTKKPVRTFYYPVNGSEYEIMYSIENGMPVFYGSNREGKFEETPAFIRNGSLYSHPTYFDMTTRSAIAIFGRDFAASRVKIMMMNEYYAKKNGLNFMVIDQMDYLILIREHKDLLLEHFAGVFKEQKEKHTYNEDEFTKIVFDFKRFVEDLGIKITPLNVVVREGVALNLAPLRIPTKGAKALEELLVMVASAKLGIFPEDVFKKVNNTSRIRKANMERPSVLTKVHHIAGERKAKMNTEIEAKRSYTKDAYNYTLGQMKRSVTAAKNFISFMLNAKKIFMLAKAGRISPADFSEFLNTYDGLIDKFYEYKYVPNRRPNMERRSTIPSETLTGLLVEMRAFSLKMI